MSTILNPYISFLDNAREALAFYESVFGGTATVSTYGEFGLNPDPAQADKVMHGQLDTPGGLTLMVSDAPSHEMFNPGSRISISLSGENIEELTRFWTGLSVGGSITVPFEKAPWGDHFGMFTDKFGVDWMVNGPAE